MTETIAIHVSTELRLHTHRPITPETFHARVTDFADHVMDLEGQDADLSDTSVSGDAGELTVTVETVVHTDDHIEAIMKTLTLTRSAIHAIGDSTPGWPGVHEILAALQQANVHTESALLPA